ncbi:hypothetical protein BH11BAC3_BH11BAC3_22430 [soil metagenome]
MGKDAMKYSSTSVRRNNVAIKNIGWLTKKQGKSNSVK